MHAVVIADLITIRLRPHFYRHNLAPSDIARSTCKEPIAVSHTNGVIHAWAPLICLRIYQEVGGSILMKTNLILSGIAAFGAAGLILTAAPAHATELTALDGLTTAEVHSALAGGHPASHEARPASPPSQKPAPEEEEDDDESGKITETEGHEMDLGQRNNCNNKHYKIYVILKNAKKNRVKVYLPAKDGTCAFKSKTAVKHRGKVSAKKVRQ